MCLAVPGQIIAIHEEPETPDQEASPLMRTGKVRFGGITRQISLAYVPEAQVGDYVIVHVGFAISRVDEEEARKALEYARDMEELAELEESHA